MSAAAAAPPRARTVHGLYLKKNICAHRPTRSIPHSLLELGVDGAKRLIMVLSAQANRTL